MYITIIPQPKCSISTALHYHYTNYRCNTYKLQYWLQEKRRHCGVK